MKRILILICILVLSSTVFGDIIYLNDGEEYSGRLEKIEKDNLYFRIDAENSVRVFKKDDIEILKLSLLLEDSDKKHISELNDPILSQAVNVNPDEIPESDSGYVILFEGVEFSPEQYSLRKIILITSESGTYIGDQRFYFKRDSEEFKINFARTINRDGKIFNIYENGIQEETINYDNQYSRMNGVKFTLPEVREGNIIDFKVTKRSVKKVPLEEPYLSEVFIDAVPVLKKEVRISGFSGVQGYFEKVINNNGEYGNPKVVKAVLGDRTIYMSTEIKQYSRETFIPPLKYIAPVIFAGVNLNEEELPGLVLADYPGDTEILQKIFGEFYKKFSFGSLNEKLEEEFMIEVFGYLFQNLCSVDILPESYYFKPKSIKQIIDNKRGNYLDKNYFYLKAITLADGFSGGLLFIAPFYDGPSEPELLNLNQFYLPVTYIKTPSGKEFYIDAYSDKLTWGTVQDYYSGSAGILILKDRVEKKVFRMPEPEENFTETAINIKLQRNGDAEVYLKTVFHGIDSETVREFKEYPNAEK
ncbi:MAG TPA: DUF3857 domain-containing protein, partial [Firmicutes bacterium]|nr:DUF3857 domain-containing protein [Bacillota bacterium]